eukprot:CAMPEP_0197583730 /NCGR_PEP_ID=MMETSP1326-20131121/6541_1 /TAXON_ID=1155430 /ORGANISM="Genus nov. species nov., Strain RCC2288" /LENGTH=500 /DNA_ID=CAMNT_0043147987 /DNA_START=81 /DNA_END=1583 /DNA_ORIENTATION=-
MGCCVATTAAAVRSGSAMPVRRSGGGLQKSPNQQPRLLLARGNAGRVKGGLGGAASRPGGGVDHRQVRAAAGKPLLSDTEDKDLWEELELDAVDTLDKPLWEVVQGAPVGRAKRDVSLEVSIFGENERQSLQIQKADFTVNSIIDKISRNKVNLRPSYQREYVWTIRTASKLVESLILNIPIPTMFFHEVESGLLEVVDGKQRLTSIWSFIQGEFPDGTPFKLAGLEVFEELNGKTFKSLDPGLQETILDYPLNVHTISRQSQPDFVFEVFERLNMGATQLNEQELRNCIYQGVYTDLLCELSNNEHLLSIYRSKQPHLRMRDRELILRFFAMQRTTPAGFTSPIKSWLNEEIRENKDMTLQEAAEMKASFGNTIRLVWEVFGDSAFRPVKVGAVTGDGPTTEELSGIFYRDFYETGEINVALWDTVMDNFSGRSDEEVLPNRERIMAAFIKMASGTTFRRLLVSQPKAVVARSDAWGNIMDAICGPRKGSKVKRKVAKK